jgi:hypothetical protein
MVYFGQEVGEPGDGNAGYGSETRTTIYDYWGVPSHTRWMNKGAFDGGNLSKKEKELRDFYKTLLNFTLNSKALMGKYHEIHSFNRALTEWYNDRVFSFVRWNEDERLIIVVNFDTNDSFGFELQLPGGIVETWNLHEGSYTLKDMLRDHTKTLVVKDGKAVARIDIEPLESLILSVQERSGVSSILDNKFE